MIIEITMRPVFWLSLFRRDVDILLKLAEHHYDSECRAAGRLGGFLFGWRNVTSQQDDQSATEIEDVSKCNGTRRDLDIVMKICEGARPAVRSRLITQEDMARVDILCSTIMTALETATVACQNMRFDPITAPTQRGQLLWSTSPGRM
jgi:hypothetical protein